MTFAKATIGRTRKLPTDAKIIELFNAGLNNREIAEKFGCTQQAVGNCVRRLNLTRDAQAPAEMEPAIQDSPRRNVVRRHFSSTTVSLPLVRGWYETDRHD
ncbi:hypothetical protein I6F11_04300 [Ensifer sp. NBAIM29]|nr:hypothetical protein [Ensifer sp. NBAIM29]